MDSIFKRDAFLYLAFVLQGLAVVAEDFYQKLICIGGSVLILVLRSLVKKYLEG